MKLTGILLSLLFFAADPAVAARPQSAPPLRLVLIYKMPATIKGRFDHLAADVAGNRLFLAAESAHEVLVFNLRKGQYLRAITGIGIPHAIFVRHDLNRIYVTDGGAGAVRIYDGTSYKLLKTVKLKVDADSIGYDPSNEELYVDNGGGDANETFSMLSVIDTTAGQKLTDIRIDGRTLEAMALTKNSPMLYVNNPAKNDIGVVNRKTKSLVASWPVKKCQRNVAMALDEPANRLFVACRSGAIAIFNTQTGKEDTRTLPIPKGVDDLIYDPVHKRLYASCGAGGGAIAVYQVADASHNKYKSLGTIPSGPGGKNEVLVPQLGRLYVTIPPHSEVPGEVYVYKVQ